MTNEEKALELSTNCDGEILGGNLYAARQMAQWKDKQLDSAIDKALERNGEFLKAGKITQYGYDIAFATIQNIREYLKQ
jgi:hypothetical protein